MGDGGAGNQINALIEAQQRARELGSQPGPDAAEERTERMTQRATAVGVGILITAAVWLFAGPVAAAIAFAALAVVILGGWWIAARL